MQEACRRAQTYWIVYFYNVVAISSYRWSFEVLTFLRALCRASTVLLVQCTCNLRKKFSLKKFMFSFKSLFFDINHNRWGRLRKQINKLSIKCNQCTLSMNNSNAWHYTYLTGNAHGKQHVVDEISCLLGKFNWPKLFYLFSWVSE